MKNDRLAHLSRFYAMVDMLEQRIGGQRTLADCSGRLDWPQPGVYFFREAGETRLRQRQRSTHRARRHARAEGWLQHQTLDPPFAAQR